MKVYTIWSLDVNLKPRIITEENGGFTAKNPKNIMENTYTFPVGIVCFY